MAMDEKKIQTRHPLEARKTIVRTESRPQRYRIKR